MPVHLSGHVGDLSGLARVAERHGIALAEDAAQAHGAERDGVRAGSASVAAGFSFYPGKNLGAFGDGGAVTTNDRALAARVRSLSNHGRSGADGYPHPDIGSYSRLAPVQAVVLTAKLRRLDEWTDRRRKVVAAYSERAPHLPLRLVEPGAGVDSAWHLLVARLSHRDPVRVELTLAACRQACTIPSLAPNSPASRSGPKEFFQSLRALPTRLCRFRCTHAHGRRGSGVRLRGAGGRPDRRAQRRRPEGIPMSAGASSTPGPSAYPGGRPRARPGIPPLVVPRQIPGGAKSRAGRRWRAVTHALMFMVLLLAPPTVAAALSASQPPTYASEVVLLYQPDPSSPADGIDRELATHRVLIQQRSLLEAVAWAVGRDPEELRDDMSVEIVEGSSVLQLRVKDRDADRARETAQPVANRYLAFNGELRPSPGTLRALASARVLDDPVAPQTLSAAAAGALLGLVLVALLLLMLRSRRERGGRAGS